MTLTASKLDKPKVAALVLKQMQRAEKTVAKAFRAFIDDQVKSIIAELNASQAAVASVLFNPAEWDAKLIDTMQPVLGKILFEGAVAEILLHKKKVSDLKATTATEAVAEYDLDFPFATELPTWMIDAVNAQLDDTFSRDYWQAINETTRDDLSTLIRGAVEDGLPIADIASRIRRDFGSVYSRARAVNVARTETTASVNGGHMIGMQRLEDAGLVTGKKWSSVLGNTTRTSHAKLHNVKTEGVAGLFDLNGVLVPFPSHPDLPAPDRCS
ncbi:MAG: hypothetical protein IID44_07175 [Planctomycetes bacterium]|nr:hypothetical protein [Planctomycetota bacterium]